MHTWGRRNCLKTLKLKCSLGEKVIDDIYTVGVLKYANLDTNEHALIEDRFTKLKKTLKFKRIYFHGQVLQSKEYTCVSKRNSYTIQYVDRSGNVHVGHVKYYLKCF